MTMTTQVFKVWNVGMLSTGCSDDLPRYGLVIILPGKLIAVYVRQANSFHHPSLCQKCRTAKKYKSHNTHIQINNVIETTVISLPEGNQNHILKPMQQTNYPFEVRGVNCYCHPDVTYICNFWHSGWAPDCPNFKKNWKCQLDLHGNGIQYF